MAQAKLRCARSAEPGDLALGVNPGRTAGPFEAIPGLPVHILPALELARPERHLGPA